jgi:hypothetical protein
VGQDGKDRESRDADLNQDEQELARPDAAEPAVGAGPADLPEEFSQEIQTALEYERGRAVKALVALAIVLLVVLIRMLFLG